MKNISIAARLAFSFAVMILIMTALTAVSIRDVSTINGHLVTVNEVNSVKQRYAINFRGSVHDRAIAIRDVVILEDEEARAASIETIQRLADDYAANEGLLSAMLAPEHAPSDQELEIAADIAEIQARTDPLVAEVVALQARGDDVAARTLLNEEVSPLFTDWLAAINRFIDYQEAQNKSLGDKVADSASGFIWLALSSLLVGVLVAGGVAFLVNRSITAPVNGLSAVMRRLADGDYDVEVAATDRRDEIGAMAATVEGFRQNGRKVAQLTAGEAQA
ncbi:MAG TPA: MCP four helix bundle domain-containing protein, partial [Phenylobacterium sp.]|nr:MCP four helix bundle domain-containing protein [Phenylobacterium sp.]